MQKFRLNFLDVSLGASFHRCVYVLVAKEAPIMAAGATAREVFGLPPAADYMPHLSLLYSDADEPTKAASRGAALARLYGDAAGYDTLLVDPGFDAQSISLWYTPAEDRTCASWARVADFALAD